MRGLEIMLFLQDFELDNPGDHISVVLGGLGILPITLSEAPLAQNSKFELEFEEKTRWKWTYALLSDGQRQDTPSIIIADV